jgi:hypothetical protein
MAVALAKSKLNPIIGLVLILGGALFVIAKNAVSVGDVTIDDPFQWIVGIAITVLLFWNSSRISAANYTGGTTTEPIYLATGVWLASLLAATAARYTTFSFDYERLLFNQFDQSFIVPYLLISIFYSVVGMASFLILTRPFQNYLKIFSYPELSRVVAVNAIALFVFLFGLT